MPALIDCHKVTKSFGSIPLFSELSFSVEEKERLGVIGPNGTGKSTLIKMLLKEEEIDCGTVSHKSALSHHLVRQSKTYPKDMSIKDLILSNLHTDTRKNIDTNDIEKHCQRLSINNINQSIDGLSGGWIKKLELCAAFVSEAELVIFDEPTNHLDFKSILWLEEQIYRANFAWICISHDRFFLNRCCQRILELNKKFPNNHFLCDGNYNDFEHKKDLFITEHISRKNTLQNQLRKENEWLKQSPKARTTKSKSRIDRAHEMQAELSLIKDKFQNKEYDIDFSNTESKRKKLIDIKNISLSYGTKKILQNFSYTLVAKEKIALLGLNGSGKSSFLKIINGELQTDSGQIKKAEKLIISYFDQKKENLPENESIKNYLCSEGDSVIFQGQSIHINSWAMRFGFEHDKLSSPIKKLSGGEKARLMIAKMMLSPADVLLLDEPTNDLDIQTLEVLEEGLKSFEGSIILVSHDRFTLEKICTNFLGINESGQIQTYISFKQWERETFLQKEKIKTQSKITKKEKTPQKKLSYLEERELSQMEDKVQKTETQITKLKNTLEKEAHSQDHKKLSDLASELNELENKLESLFERWQELEEKKQSFLSN